MTENHNFFNFFFKKQIFLKLLNFKFAFIGLPKALRHKLIKYF